jgi:hypothetical protein
MSIVQGPPIGEIGNNISIFREAGKSGVFLATKGGTDKKRMDKNMPHHSSK